MKKLLFSLAYFIFLTDGYSSSEVLANIDHLNFAQTPYNKFNGIVNKTDEMKICEDSIKNSITINASDLNITDDSIALQLKYPQPLTVTEACVKIKECNTPPMKLSLDLSGNTICDEGSETIAKTIIRLSNLKDLNISWNRINNVGIQKFITKLFPLIIDPDFKELNITGNYGANRSNVEKTIAKLPLDQQALIKQKIKY